MTGRVQNSRIACRSLTSGHIGTAFLGTTMRITECTHLNNSHITYTPWPTAMAGHSLSPNSWLQTSTAPAGPPHHMH